MSATRIVGIVLVVFGIFALSLGGISWTHRKTVVDAGPVEIKTDKHERIPLPPAVGVIAIVGGVVLLLMPGRIRS